MEAPKPPPEAVETVKDSQFDVKQLNEYYSNKSSQVTVSTDSKTLAAYGKIDWDDGASYIGFLLNGVAHGSGVFIYPDGSIYTGHF